MTNVTGHIPSATVPDLTAATTQQLEQLTSAGTLAQSTPIGEARAVPATEATIERMKEGLIGEGSSLVRVQARLLVVLHVNNPLFYDTLKATRRVEFERSGRVSAYNVYSPFSRSNPKKASSVDGILRHAMANIFGIVDSWNNLNLAVPSDRESLNTGIESALRSLKHSIHEAVPVGRKQPVAALESGNVRLGDLFDVTTYAASGDSTTLTACIHVQMPALYDTEEHGTVLNNAHTYLNGLAERFPNAAFNLCVGVGADAMPYGTTAELLNFLLADENLQCVGHAALRTAPWAPADLQLLTGNSDILFVKPAKVAFGTTEAPAQ